MLPSSATCRGGPGAVLGLPCQSLTISSEQLAQMCHWWMGDAVPFNEVWHWHVGVCCCCFEGVLFFYPNYLSVCYMPYAKCSRAGGWACDWALQVVSAWIKDCRRLLQTWFFFFHLLEFFFHCPFSDKMKTWHFLQPSSKLWRTWRLDWIPGNTRLETPSCITQQVSHWF